MGYYKQLKERMREMVRYHLEDWIVEMEKGKGNQVWDRFSSVTSALQDFSECLSEALKQRENEESPTSIGRRFRVEYTESPENYSENTEANYKDIDCPTEKHAKILFRREKPEATILHIIDITPTGGVQEDVSVSNRDDL